MDKTMMEANDDLLVPFPHDGQTSKDDINFYVSQYTHLPCCLANRFHRHPFYEVLWLSHGEATFHCDFHSYGLVASTLVFVSPGQIHMWQGDWDAADLTIIGFKPALLSLNPLLLHCWTTIQPQGKNQKSFYLPISMSFSQSLSISMAPV